MQLIQYDNPFEATQALIRDYAEALYGVKNASALTVLCEVAFDPEASRKDRTSAASTLLRYERPSFKAVEALPPDTKPVYHIHVLGKVEALSGPAPVSSPEGVSTESDDWEG